jgi:hypothetical protein
MIAGTGDAPSRDFFPCRVRARCLGASSLPSTDASYHTTLAVTSVSSHLCHASTGLRMGSKFRCIRSTQTKMQSISENDLECWATTGVKFSRKAKWPQRAEGFAVHLQNAPGLCRLLRIPAR